MTTVLFRLAYVCVVCLSLASCSGGSSTAAPNNPTPAPATPVVPQYAGSWSGKWQHLACTNVNSPTFDWCNGIIIGDSAGLTLTLTQNGNTATGSLNLSGVVMVVEGSIGTDGALSLSGTRLGSPGQSVADWRSTINGSTLEGTFTWNDLHSDPPLGRRLSDRLLDVRRVN